MRVNGREAHLGSAVAPPVDDVGHPEARAIAASLATAHHGLKVPRQMIAVGRDAPATPGAGPTAWPALT